MDETKLLTTNALIKELKVQIISQARAVFCHRIASGDISSTGRVIDVIVSKHLLYKLEIEHFEHKAHVILYTGKETDEFAAWTVLATSPQVWGTGPVPALNGLLEEMYRQAGMVVKGLK